MFFSGYKKNHIKQIMMWYVPITILLTQHTSWMNMSKQQYATLLRGAALLHGQETG
jgi:hypothetical protein